MSQVADLKKLNSSNNLGVELSHQTLRSTSVLSMRSSFVAKKDETWIKSLENFRITDYETSKNARIRFKLAIEAVLKYLKSKTSIFAKYGIQYSQQDDDSEAEEHKERSPFSFNLTEYQSHNQRLITTAIRKILAKPSNARSQQDITILLTVMDKVKAFDKYSLSIRKKICQVITLQTVPKQRIVVKQNHPAHSFYFILSGLVVSSQEDKEKQDEDVEMRINHELKEGDSFGDSCLTRDFVRPSTIITLKTTEFLKLEKDAFQLILKAAQEENLQKRLGSLQSTPIFTEFDHQCLEILSNYCTSREYPQGSVITDEDYPAEDIIFITSGTCGVFKKIPLVKKHYSATRFGYHAYDPQVKLQDNEKLVDKVIRINTLRRGDSFGEDDLFMKTRRQALNQVFQKRQPNSHFTIVTESKVECLAIARIDFVKTVNETLFTSIRKYYKPYPDLDFIIKSFFVRRDWENLKKQYVKEIIDRKDLIRAAKFAFQ